VGNVPVEKIAALEHHLAPERAEKTSKDKKESSHEEE
jgi:hypothetical protein